jgi:hypothetical protein
MYQHLKDNVCPKIMGDLTSDFSPEGLDLLVGVMLGQVIHTVSLSNTSYVKAA